MDVPVKRFSRDQDLGPGSRKAIVSIDKLRAVGGLALAFSPDGERLAAGAGPNLVHVWDAASGRELLVTGLKRSSVECLAMSPDGDRLAVAGIARDVQILDSRTGQLLWTCSGELVHRSRLTFSPDGERLASAASGGIELWDAESGQLIRMFKGHVGPVVDVAFNPDSTLLASAGADGCVKVWDAVSDPESIPISGPLARLYVVISPDGRTALTGLGESTIQLWNTTTGKPLGEPLNLDYKQASFDFTADGNRLVLTDEGKNVTTWDVATHKVVHAFKHDGPARPIRTALSADGKWFACGGAAGELKAWDVEKGVPLARSQRLWINLRSCSAQTVGAWRRVIDEERSKSGTLPRVEIDARPRSKAASRCCALALTASSWP